MSPIPLLREVNTAPLDRLVIHPETLCTNSFQGPAQKPQPNLSSQSPGCGKDQTVTSECWPAMGYPCWRGKRVTDASFPPHNHTKWVPGMLPAGQVFRDITGIPAPPSCVAADSAIRSMLCSKLHKISFLLRASLPPISSVLRLWQEATGTASSCFTAGSETAAHPSAQGFFRGSLTESKSRCHRVLFSSPQKGSSSQKPEISEGWDTVQCPAQTVRREAEFFTSSAGLT